MGDYNITCSMSKLPIESETNIVLIPLRVSEAAQWVTEYNAEFYGGIYTYFEPLTLPIYGKYVGYGEIGNIIHDANTKAIEAYYGIPINDFCELVLSDRKDFNGELTPLIPNETETSKTLLNTVPMWVRGEVYEQFTKPVQLDWRYLGKQFLIDELVKAKFKLTETPDINNLSKGKISILIPKITNKFQVHIGKQINEFFDITNIIQYLVENKIVILTNDYPNVYQYYFESFQKEYVSVYLNGVSHYFVSGEARYDISFHHTKHNPLLTLYKDSILSGTIKDSLCGFNYFQEAMQGCNTIFFPSYRGMQYGEFEYLNKLGSITKSISEQMLKEDWERILQWKNQD